MKTILMCAAMVAIASVSAADVAADVTAMKKKAETVKPRVQVNAMERKPGFKVLIKTTMKEDFQDTATTALETVTTDVLDAMDVAAIKDAVRKYYDLKERNHGRVSVQQLPLRTIGKNYNFAIEGEISIIATPKEN